VLTPHGAEHAKLDRVRRSTQFLDDQSVFILGKRDLGQDFRSNFDQASSFLRPVPG
jgi:hypothetical protein